MVFSVSTSQERPVLFGMLWLSLSVHHNKDRSDLACCGHLCLSVHHKQDRYDLACCGNHFCQYITRKTTAIWHTFAEVEGGGGGCFRKQDLTLPPLDQVKSDNLSNQADLHSINGKSMGHI